MLGYRRSIWSLAACLAVAACTAVAEHWRGSATFATLSAVVHGFVDRYVTPVIDAMARFARAVVKSFLQPDWLAASLARLAHAVRVAQKSWNDRHQSHYRAPGSWVACGST